MTHYGLVGSPALGETSRDVAKGLPIRLLASCLRAVNAVVVSSKCQTVARTNVEGHKSAPARKTGVVVLALCTFVATPSRKLPDACFIKGVIMSSFFREPLLSGLISLGSFAPALRSPLLKTKVEESPGLIRACTKRS